MRTLYIIRHAKSSWKDDFAKDFDRKLSPRGRKNAPEMGKRLRKLGIFPDLILSSPAKRASATAKKIAEELAYEKNKITMEPSIYEATADALLSVIRRIEKKNKVVFLVGHNPSCSELVAKIPGFSIENMPTGAICGIQFESDNWEDIDISKGKCIFYDFPKNKPEKERESLNENVNTVQAA